MSAYPAHREVDVALSDGSTVHVRPIRPDDREAILTFYTSLSLTSIAFRFFTAGVDFSWVVDWALDVDHAERFGLVALRGDPARLIGHGAYTKRPDGSAEVAFAVADELQGRGLGTILLAHLAQAAADHDIDLFVADVLPDNHRMIEVFRESGFPVERRSVPGAIHIEHPTSFTSEAIARFAQRDRVAAAAAVSRFLRPRSVAVIGASRKRDSVGGQVFHNLLTGGFNGAAYPVNPQAEVVQSVTAYRSLAAVPGEVDLAVITVPAALVLDAVRACVAKGVGAVVVISAGFGEIGPEGQALQRELVEICRAGGVRLVGPNCLGVLNTAPDVSLNATFAPGAPPPGRVGFLSQSGALGLALIDLAADRNLGVSSFASIGNRADITGNDLLEYWEEDDDTDVALLYIESFSDPRRFSRVARRIGARKPVVIVKSGRSRAGSRATSSHTGALIAASDVTVDALFEQAGVIRADSLSDLLDVASLLANQPLPAGRRVGIVTNAGGPGIMCADACEAAGLDVPELPPELRDALGEFLPPAASLGNPVDMIATVPADAYRRTIAAVGNWEGVDALIVIFVRPLLTRAEEVSEAVRAGVDALEREIPVQAVFMSARDHAAMVAAGGLPTHLYPEDAARALARVVRHSEWRSAPVQEPATFADARRDEASAILADALADGAQWLSFEEVARLLDCYGIPVADWRRAGDPAEAASMAVELGGPVALKAAGREVIHKTELGAVVLGLEGAEAVAAAAAEMDERLRRSGTERDAFVVQRMAAPGVEMLVGVVLDALFGPVVACGAGGVQAELLRDVAVRVAPLTAHDAAHMVRSLATLPLLTGYRGAPAADIEALEDLVLRVSDLVDTHHEIAELDLNPVIVHPRGLAVVDARVRIEIARPAPAWPSTYAGAGA